MPTTGDRFAAVESKLNAINRQNLALADGVEVLGRFVNVGIEALQEHLRHGHGDNTE